MVRVWRKLFKGRGVTNQRPKGLVNRKREVPKCLLLVRMTHLKLSVPKAKRKGITIKEPAPQLSVPAQSNKSKDTSQSKHDGKRKVGESAEAFIST